MAVVPKHTDQSPRYNPEQDFDTQQRHRFTEVANKAQQRRELRKASMLSSMKNKALKPVVRPQKDKFNSARYGAWLVVFAAVSLWLMYMTSS